MSLAAAKEFFADIEVIGEDGFEKIKQAWSDPETRELVLDAAKLALLQLNPGIVATYGAPIKSLISMFPDPASSVQ